MFNLDQQLCTSFFFFNDTATTEIYTLSLHDALPILAEHQRNEELKRNLGPPKPLFKEVRELILDRKSTRLNSSHSQISYAVFCLKKKNRNIPVPHQEPEQLSETARHSAPMLLAAFTH